MEESEGNEFILLKPRHLLVIYNAPLSFEKCHPLDWLIFYVQEE